jgi:hypothetical protein
MKSTSVNIKDISKHPTKRMDAKYWVRINNMVDSWNENGYATSHLDNDDSAFFEKIGIPMSKVGTTSQTGSDVVYFDKTRESTFNRDKFYDNYAKGGKLPNKKRWITDLRKSFPKISEKQASDLYDKNFEKPTYADGGMVNYSEKEQDLISKMVLEGSDGFMSPYESKALSKSYGFLKSENGDDYEKTANEIISSWKEDREEKFNNPELLKVVNGINNGKLKILRGGSKKYGKLNLSIQELVWGRNFEDGFRIDVFDATDSHIGTIDLTASTNWKPEITEAYAEGGDIPKGYHKMPDGTIMADSGHYAKGGGIELMEYDVHSAHDNTYLGTIQVGKNADRKIAQQKANKRFGNPLLKVKIKKKGVKSYAKGGEVHHDSYDPETHYKVIVNDDYDAPLYFKDFDSARAYVLKNVNNQENTIMNPSGDSIELSKNPDKEELSWLFEWSLENGGRVKSKRRIKNPMGRKTICENENVEVEYNSISDNLSVKDSQTGQYVKLEPQEFDKGGEISLDLSSIGLKGHFEYSVIDGLARVYDIYYVGKNGGYTLVKHTQQNPNDFIIGYIDYLKGIDGRYLLEKLKKQDTYAKGGEIEAFKLGDKVFFEKHGKFGWEDIDEAEHGGYHIGIGEPFEVTEVDSTKGEEAIKLNYDEQWIHPNHFKLVDKKSKGGGVDDEFAKGGEIKLGEFMKSGNFDVTLPNGKIYEIEVSTIDGSPKYAIERGDTHRRDIKRSVLKPYYNQIYDYAISRPTEDWMQSMKHRMKYAKGGSLKKAKKKSSVGKYVR